MYPMIAPTVGRVLTSSGTSASTALTVGTKAISVICRTNDAYIAVGDGSQTASATTMYLPVGERVHISLIGMTAPHIAVLNGPGGAASEVNVQEYQGMLR